MGVIIIFKQFLRHQHPKIWFSYLLTRAWLWVLIQSVEKMAKGLILMYLSHLVRSEGMKIWTFWPKWAESVSARRQSVEQEKVWKVSYEAATYPGGGYQHFFAIFRSRHFFPATFLPFFLLKILHSKVYEPDFTLGPNEFSWDSQVALTWMSNRSSSQLRNLNTFSFHFRNLTISRIFLIFFSSLWFLLFYLL